MSSQVEQASCQLNQAAISLESGWLERLRFLEPARDSIAGHPSDLVAFDLPAEAGDSAIDTRQGGDWQAATDAPAAGEWNTPIEVPAANNEQAADPGEQPSAEFSTGTERPVAGQIMAQAPPAVEANTADPADRVAPTRDAAWEQMEFDEDREPESMALANSIVARFPDPATIMFISADPHIDTDLPAATMAHLIAEKNLGDVALIDANFERGRLTELYRVQQRMGLKDIINRNEPLHSLLVETGHDRLSLLPAGTGEMTHRKMDWTRISRLAVGLNRRFHFSIVSAGQAGELLTDCWAAYADGVYLLLDPRSADRNHVQRAVTHLRELGTRLIGCVVKKSTGDTAGVSH